MLNFLHWFSLGFVQNWVDLCCQIHPPCSCLAPENEIPTGSLIAGVATQSLASAIAPWFSGHTKLGVLQALGVGCLTRERHNFWATIDDPKGFTPPPRFAHHLSILITLVLQRIPFCSSCGLDGLLGNLLISEWLYFPHWKYWSWRPSYCNFHNMHFNLYPVFNGLLRSTSAHTLANFPLETISVVSSTFNFSQYYYQPVQAISLYDTPLVRLGNGPILVMYLFGHVAPWS